jgi:hypothetical protein
MDVTASSRPSIFEKDTAHSFSKPRTYPSGRPRFFVLGSYEQNWPVARQAEQLGRCPSHLSLGTIVLACAMEGQCLRSRTFFDPAPIARPRHSLPLCSDIILAGAFSFPVVGVSINVHTAKATYPCLYLATSRYDPRERSSTRLIEPCFVSLHCRFSTVVQREQMAQDSSPSSRL